MKRTLALLLCFIVAVCALASCDALTGGGTQQHTHTFSETWSSDAQGHWHDATCDCEDADITKIDHTDGNNDGACDICKFSNHTHTYESESWTSDCTNHWRAATCGHIVAGTDLAEHSDDNNDGMCDVCNYMIENLHVHIYDKELSSDESYHWYAAICEHKDQIDGKEAHNIDATGYCTVCGTKLSDIDRTDIAQVLRLAMARHAMVKNGTIKHVQTNEIREAKTNVFYALGPISTYVSRNDSAVQWTSPTAKTSATSYIQYWFELIGEEEVFAVVSENGGVTVAPAQAELYQMNGYDYTPSSIFKVDVATDSLENVLYAFYDLTVNHDETDVVTDVVIKRDNTGNTYHLSYNFLDVNVTKHTDPDTGNSTIEYGTNYFVVDIEFTVNDNGVIIHSEFTVDSYSPITLDKFNSNDQLVKPDYTYDPETGAFAMTADAHPDRYTYVVDQVAGERTYYTAYPQAAMVPSDFDIILADTEMDYTQNGGAGVLVTIPGTEKEVGDSLTLLQKSGTVTLFFVNPTPSSANFAFLGDKVSVSIVDKDNPDNTNLPYVYHSGDHVSCGLNKLGTFTLTIAFNNIIKVVDITVVKNAAQSIAPYVFSMEDDNWGGSAYTVKHNNPTTEITIAAGEYFDFIGAIEPLVVEQAYKVTVDNADASVAEITLNDVMVFDEPLDSTTAYRFTSDTAGTYIITLQSTKKSTVKATLTVTVE